MTTKQPQTSDNSPGDVRAVALARSIPKVDGFCSQQVVSPSSPATKTDAVLIDQWGQVHALAQRVVVGREPGDDGIAVLESSVSREHAELKRDKDGDGWWLSDLASTNGTFVDGRRLDGPEELSGHQVLMFGDIGFVFIADRNQVSLHAITDSVLQTEEAPRATPEGTEVIRLFAASSGAGGLVDYRGNTAQLGSTQFALITSLANRYLSESGQPSEVRGYVRSIELIHELPWDTRNPADNNVKQLVRRVRRALDKIGVENAIEARQRFGYRLAIVPIIVNR